MPNGVLELGKTLEFSVFPVPTKGDVFIAFKLPSSGVIQVSDATGKIHENVQVIEETMVEVRLPEATGLYVVKYLSADLLLTRKIIKSD